MQDRRVLLFYVHALSGGGAERVIARLASGFAARGDRVLLAVDHEADAWRTSLDPAVELVLLPKGHLRSVGALARLLRREEPKVSFSALSAANLKHVVAALLAGRARRAIISYHGFFQNEPERLSRLGFLLSPALSRLVGASVAVSEALRKNLIEKFWFPPTRVVTIYNPAAPEPPHPPLDPAALAAREPLVVAMGRLVEEKGFRFLVRAFARVAHPQARLVILGKGPQREALEREAQRLGVAERLALPGYTDPDSYLERARCFVSPSYHESFGLAIVEALDSGLAVVATRSGGPQEIIDSEAAGRLVPVGDEMRMAAAISASLEAPGDPAPRQRRAAAFSHATAMERYEGLFREVGGG
ncbi:MAG TPA: glycosyltransferase [Methylocystis sp.]|nr:glycosyltransferase [Methylocystis sp.]